MQANIELVLILGGFLFFIFLCAAISFGKGRPSGATRRPTASEKGVEGFGGAKALDYTHAPSFRTIDKPGIPVSGRLEREKTDTHKMSKGDEEEKL
ncbi:MAG: hypothetical protein ACFFAY_13650 [Promethearchaeota archaeon]